MDQNRTNQPLTSSAYVFQGMMVNEFQHRSYACSPAPGTDRCHCTYPSALQDQCKIAGTAVLDQYGYATNYEGKWVGILIGIIVVYRVLGYFFTWLRKS